MPVSAPPLSGATRRDVADFLAAHDECTGRFEIRRPDGPAGRFRLHCSGCRESISLAVGELGPLRAGPQASPAGVRKGPSSRQVERWLPAPAALPWWVPNAYIVALVAIGLAMIAFGLASTRKQPEAVVLGGPQRAAPAPGAAGSPTAGTAGSTAAAQAVPLAPAPEPSASEQGGGSPREGLDRVTVLNRFTIGVPEGWVGGTGDGAVVFRPAATAQADLRVFLEPGDGGPRRLSRDAAGFLEAEHPGAKLSRPRRLQIGGDPAFTIMASHRGGRERAVVLSESGYEYLLLSRIGVDQERRVRVQTAAALKSFRAL